MIAEVSKSIADDDLHENKLIAIFIVILVFAFVGWKVILPNMKANNIFSKNHPRDYGRSEFTKKNRKFTPLQALALSFLLNIAEILNYLYNRFFVKTPVVVYHINPHDRHYQPGMAFIISLFILLAMFIYTFIDEADFSFFRDFKYAMKVWLTTAFLSPLLLVFIYKAMSGLNVHYMYLMYLQTTVMVNGSCFAVSGSLIMAVNYFSRKTWRIPKKRMRIFWCAQAALLPSILILALLMNYGWGWIVGWLVYAVIMGVAIFRYTMEYAVYSDETYYITESIE